MNLKTNILALLLILTCTFSFSQKRRSSITGRKKTKYNKGRSHQKPINYINSIKGTFFLGSSKYTGDIAGRFESFNSASYNFGFGAQYRYSEHIVLRTNLNLVRITGDDKFGTNPTRNLSFKTNIYEWNVQGVYDLFRFNKMYRRRRQITPYGILGVGLFYYNPKAELDGTNYALRGYQTEGQSYSAINYSVQFGGGFRYKLNPHIDIAFEAIFKKTFTDYLDDVSTVYPTDILEWTDPIRQGLSYKQEDRPIERAPGEKRGNPDNKDAYLTIGFRLEYTLQVTKQRYSLKRNRSRLRMHKGIRKKR
jgi:hypothetical protein